MVRQYLLAATIVTLMVGIAAVGAEPPAPAMVQGTVTVDGQNLSTGSDDGYVFRAVRTDGSAFEPPAEDTDGLNIFGWYLISVPMYDVDEQPGGAVPGESAIIRVLKDGEPLTVTSPSEGRFAVGGSGSSLFVNLKISSEGGPGDPGDPGDNQPPVAAAGPDQQVIEGTTVTLDGSNSSDPDEDDTLTFLWEQVNGGTTVTLSEPTAVQPTFTAPTSADAGGALTFQLTVTDGAGASDSDTTTVNLVAASSGNYPPVADAGPYQTVGEGEIVTLDGSNSTDRENAIVSYEWRQISGTPVALSNPNVMQPTFVAPEVEAKGEALTFELTVTDADEQKNTDRVTVNVTFQNQPPVAEAGDYQTVTEGEIVTLSGLNSIDPDGGISEYVWTQVSGPSVTLSDPTSVQPTFTAPDVGVNGASVSFELVVTDNGGLKNADRVTVNVTYQNQPPAADAGDAVTVDAGAEVTLDGSGSTDPDDGIDGYKWTQISGPAVTLSNAGEPQPTFTAPIVAAPSEALEFELEVTDTGGLKDADSVTVTVQFVNQPPAANAGEDGTVVEETLVTLDGTGSTDPDDGIVTYAWTRLEGPEVELSDPAIPQPTFTAPALEDETEVAIVFQLEVTDGADGTATDTVTVTVTPNLPPTADAGEDGTVVEGAQVTLDGTGSTDPDDGIASYAWTQIDDHPALSLTGADTATASFTAPPVDGADRVYAFQLEVTDGAGQTATDEVTVRVTPNLPPTADAGQDQAVEAGDAVILDGTGSSDPDDGIDGYRWSQVAGDPEVALQGVVTETARFTAPEVDGAATLVFQLAVTDTRGERATDEVTVTVTPPSNLPPTADAGTDRTVNEGETVTLSGAGSSDPDGGIVSYEWIQLDGPAVTLSAPGGTDPSATFLAPAVDPAGAILTFQLTVEDAGARTETDTVKVTVTDIDGSGDADWIPLMTATDSPDTLLVERIEGDVIYLLEAVAADEAPNPGDRPEDLIYGLIDVGIKAAGADESAYLTIRLPSAVADGYTWYAVGDDGIWYDYTDGATYNAARDEVTIEFENGGAIDREANDEQIRVLFGLGTQPASPPGNPGSIGGGGDGDSNCFIGSAGGSMGSAWGLWLVALAGLGALRRRMR